MCVEACGFACGVRVVGRADVVEAAIDRVCADVFGAFEHHVPKVVRDSHERGLLVAGAGFDEESSADRLRVGIDLGEDGEPVVERRCFEFYWHGWSVGLL